MLPATGHNHKKRGDVEIMGCFQGARLSSPEKKFDEDAACKFDLKFLR